jgi:hypothetical protein
LALAAAAALTGGVAPVALAQTPGPVERRASSGPFEAYGGEWDSEWGTVFLLFDGEQVSGEWGEGYLRGKVDDKGNIAFKWASADGKTHGKGMFIIQKNGRIVGSWGFSNSANNGGEWVLSRK